MKFSKSLILKKRKPADNIRERSGSVVESLTRDREKPHRRHCGVVLQDLEQDTFILA